VAEYRIPLEYLTAVIDGVEMDLDAATFATFADLEIYCYRVASVVGLACIHIWGFRGPQAIGPARDCGLAFQLTNILRDLKEDSARGRIYLPREDLAQFCYSERDLCNAVADQRFRNLMRHEIARAERFYDSARALEPNLDRSGRRVFRAMSATYRALLQKISRDPARVFRRRVRLSRWEKMQIAMDAFFLRPAPLAAIEECHTVSS
jgi:phytoene synthase